MVLAVLTPHKDPEGAAESQRTPSSLDNIDVEWVAEHARQVGNMCRLKLLPLCVSVHIVTVSQREWVCCMIFGSSENLPLEMTQ